MPQFSIRELLVLAGIACVAVALIADEPIRVGLATLFCVFSYAGISLLALFSGKELWRQVISSAQQRSVRPMIGRIKWLLVDTIIIVWLFAVISTVNFVLQNYVHQAPWLLLGGLLICPLAILRLRYHLRRTRWVQISE